MISLHPAWSFSYTVRGRNCWKWRENVEIRKIRESGGTAEEEKNREDRKRPETARTRYHIELCCVMLKSYEGGRGRKRKFCLGGREAARKLFWTYLQLHGELHYDRNIYGE
jgi:hypothetical protein